MFFKQSERDPSVAVAQHLWRCLVLVAFASVTAIEASPAQDLAVDTSLYPTRGMTVGGHTFSPTASMPDPFIRTFARNSLGFGRTPNLEIPLVEIGGTPYTWNSGNLIFSLIQFEFQGALREWLAFDAQINVTGRLANETIPLLSQGVVLITGYELGALFRVHRSEDMTLALAAGATNVGVTNVDLRRFISAIIDSNALTPNNFLVASTPSVHVFGEVRVAYGFNDLFGIMGQARLAYGEAAQRQASDRWFMTFAMLLDLNLQRRWNAPIGFAFGVKTSTNPGGANEDGRSIASFVSRVSYLGARDFELGVDLSYNRIPVTSLPDKTTFLAATIDMRLLF